MIAVALPRMIDELGIDVTTAGWLATAYLIVVASLQPVGGKLGDRFGRRPFLLGGLAVLGLASVGAALSTEIGPLIAFRCGQALAASVLFPNGSALLREAVPEHRRGSRFGMLGALISLGAAIGPPAGGVLVGLGGWPAIFWVNVPLVLVVFVVGLRAIPVPIRRATDARFDAGGAVVLAAVLGTVAWVLNRGIDRAGGPGVIVAALLGFAVFLVWELRHADPVVQLRLFGRMPFVSACGGVALSNFSLYVVLLSVPLLLDERGWSESGVGGVLAAMSVAMAVVAPLGGRAADRFGRRIPAVVGLSVLASGLAALALVGATASGVVLVVCLFVSGLGLGLSNPSLSTSAVESVEAHDSGMAAATYSTSRYLGSIVGTSILAGLLAPGGPGFGFVLWLVTGAALAATALAPGLAGRPRRAPADTDVVGS